MPASLIQRQKSSAKEEMVTPRVGCWPKGLARKEAWPDHDPSEMRASRCS